MKWIIFFKSFLILLLFGACCTKKDCYGVLVELKEVKFHNFEESELDSVMVFAIENASNINTVKDSFYLQFDSGFDLTNAYLVKPIDIHLAYVFRFKNSSKEYILSNFELITRHWNKCFPFKIEDDSFVYLDAYEVNGVRQSFRNQIDIYK